MKKFFITIGLIVVASVLILFAGMLSLMFPQKASAQIPSSLVSSEYTIANIGNECGRYSYFQDFRTGEFSGNIFISPRKECNKRITLTHEQGHKFYFEKMTPAQRNEWNKISWWGCNQNKYIYTAYPSFYAMENCKEDFAESSALYWEFPARFVLYAQKNGIMRKKLNFLNKVYAMNLWMTWRERLNSVADYSKENSIFKK